MKKLAVILASVLLAGCSVGHVKFDSSGEKFTSRQTAGIPYLASITGTATAVSPHLSVTAKHVADQVVPDGMVLARHPNCDVAFIAADNREQPTFPDFAHPRFDHAQLYGYSANTLQPVSGEGKVVGVARYKGCLVYRAAAGGMQGMSGGPVVQDGKVVGVIIGLDMNRKEVIFVGMDTIGSWLDKLRAGEIPKR